jgi:hypothetical protein
LCDSKAPEYVKILRKCWSYDAAARPPARHLVDSFRSLLGLPDLVPRRTPSHRIQPAAEIQVVTRRELPAPTAAIAYIACAQDTLVGLRSGELLWNHGSPAPGHKAAIDAVGQIGMLVWTVADRTLALRDLALTRVWATKLPAAVVQVSSVSPQANASATHLVLLVREGGEAGRRVLCYKLTEHRLELVDTIEAAPFHSVLIAGDLLWLGDAGFLAYRQLVPHVPLSGSRSLPDSTDGIAVGLPAAAVTRLKSASDAPIFSLQLLADSLLTCSASELCSWDPVSKTLWRTFDFSAPLLSCVGLPKPDYVLVETDRTYVLDLTTRTLTPLCKRLGRTSQDPHRAQLVCGKAEVLLSVVLPFVDWLHTQREQLPRSPLLS